MKGLLLLMVPAFQRDSAHWWREGREQKKQEVADHTSNHTQEADREQDVGRGYKRPKACLQNFLQKICAS